MDRRMTPAEAERRTRELLNEHGLWDWSIGFGNAKNTAGTCSYAKKRITFSKYLLARRPYEDGMDTVTHEVAHAIVGARYGHGLVWQAKHRELGGSGRRCFSFKDTDSLWVGVCPHGKQFPRHRQPKRMNAWSCRCPGGGGNRRVTWHKRADYELAG